MRYRSNDYGVDQHYSGSTYQQQITRNSNQDHVGQQDFSESFYTWETEELEEYNEEDRSPYYEREYEEEETNNENDTIGEYSEYMRHLVLNDPELETNFEPEESSQDADYEERDYEQESDYEQDYEQEFESYDESDEY